jgi:membrane protease subunit (stomatin/prohibitin family)
MALIDVVKWDAAARALCWKFPSNNLRLGTQLVVYPSQAAFFVRDGKICDYFQSGTYTLETKNIPLLTTLISIPFGYDTPFQAEVWFVNLTSHLDIKWGTPAPIQLEDPKYAVIVPVRAFGQYGVKVKNPEVFLTTFVGNAEYFSSDKVDLYFKGKILSLLSSLISQKIMQESISILNINSYLVEMSEYCTEELNKKIVEKYGIEILDFTFSSINFPQDDPSILKLKEAKDMAARMKIAGKDVYQMERSFDVMERAAENEGGGFTAMGGQMAAGMSVGAAMGGIFNQNLNTGSPMPPPATVYFVLINGQQQGSFTVQHIQTLIGQGQVAANTLAWKQGMSGWNPISTIPELAGLFSPAVPPPPPIT